MSNEEDLVKKYKDKLKTGLGIRELGKFRDELTKVCGIPGTSAQALGKFIQNKATEKEVLEFIRKDKNIGNDIKKLFEKVLK